MRRGAERWDMLDWSSLGPAVIAVTPATAREILRKSVVSLESGYGPRHPRTLEASALLDTLGRSAAPSPSPSALSKRLM